MNKKIFYLIAIFVIACFALFACKAENKSTEADTVATEETETVVNVETVADAETEEAEAFTDILNIIKNGKKSIYTPGQIYLDLENYQKLRIYFKKYQKDEYWRSSQQYFYLNSLREIVFVNEYNSQLKILSDGSNIDVDNYNFDICTVSLNGPSLLYNDEQQTISTWQWGEKIFEVSVQDLVINREIRIMKIQNNFVFIFNSLDYYKLNLENGEIKKVASIKDMASVDGDEPRFPLPEIEFHYCDGLVMFINKDGNIQIEENIVTGNEEPVYRIFCSETGDIFGFNIKGEIIVVTKIDYYK